MQRINAIPYVTRDGMDLCLDIAIPDGDGPHPAVVYVHGGGWAFGERDTYLIDWLAANGFVALSISYRFTDIAPFPAQIHDLKSSIRWLRRHASTYGVDPDHIGVWGTSAGGHLAALAACTNLKPWFEGDGNDGYRSDVQCSIPICAPVEFLINWYAVDQLPIDDEGIALAEALFGGGLAEAQDLRCLGSPLWQIDANAAPQLIIHGALDSLVPVGQARAYAASLGEVGVSHELIVVPDKGHDVHDCVEMEIDEPASLRRQVLAFFREHLTAQ